MKLQQLRYAWEVYRRGNHISAAAEALQTSQPGISKQIKLLESELGFEIFSRRRNRIVGLTEPGREVVSAAQRILTDVDNFRLGVPMLRALVLITVLLAFAFSARAEMEKISTPCDTGVCIHWWPKLPPVKGWHHDREQSLSYGFNAQAPDGKTFVDAETVIYANAPYKPRKPETKTLQMLIDNDQKQFRSNTPGVRIREVAPLVTGDGHTLRSFTYFPQKEGNWEQVSYGEEGDFYLIFAVSSRTRKGLAAALTDYKKFINSYKARP